MIANDFAQSAKSLLDIGETEVFSAKDFVRYRNCEYAKPLVWTPNIGSMGIPDNKAYFCGRERGKAPEKE